jgi:hypothetical protein
VSYFKARLLISLAMKDVYCPSSGTKRAAQPRILGGFAYTNMLKRILSGWTVDPSVSDDVSRN